MSVSIPFSFTGGAGNKAIAAQVNANFNALAAKFTEGAGGISDADISTTAGIKGSKLSSVAGLRVTQAQMDDDAVDFRVLKDDAGAGAPNAAVQTAAHIKDAIITNAKLVPATIAKDRLKVTEVTQAFVINIPVPFTGVQSTLVVPVPALPLMAAMMPLRCTIEGYAIVGGTSAGAIVNVVEDTVPTVFYCVHYHANAGGAFTINGTIRFTYLALT